MCFVYIVYLNIRVKFVVKITQLSRQSLGKPSFSAPLCRPLCWRFRFRPAFRGDCVPYVSHFAPHERRNEIDNLRHEIQITCTAAAWRQACVVVHILVGHKRQSGAQHEVFCELCLLVGYREREVRWHKFALGRTNEAIFNFDSVPAQQALGLVATPSL